MSYGGIGAREDSQAEKSPAACAVACRRLREDVNKPIIAA